jgi:hypothetical protein
MIVNWLRSCGRRIENQRAAKEAFIRECGCGKEFIRDCGRDKESVANLST